MVCCMNKHKTLVEKYVLKNGLHILIYPLRATPKVSLQMWYGVGSKDEQAGQHGLAHFLEHMMFKGSEKLSESDISLVTTKLSASCNAFTSQDYTSYIFEVPSQHWYEVLPLFADCMVNASFRPELLKAELKTVIQELKMYRDDYEETLSEQMATAIFTGHPYHHPIIGYKQDIWNFKQEMLRSFYKLHYAPNNATLVIVGDIDSADALQRITQMFESIPACYDYMPAQHIYNQDTVASSITLYRDVQQSVAQYAFVIPGVRAGQSHLAEMIALILCNGRGSRLYKKLVDELQIATDIEACTEDMFDYSLFFITVYPKEIGLIHRIEQEIVDELTAIQHKGFTAEEIERARKKMTVGHLLLFDNYEQLAYEIGKCFLAAQDENYIINYMNSVEDKDFAHKLNAFCREYFRRLVMHKGFILPLPEDEKERWITLQEQEDEQDEQLVARLVRTIPLEQGRYVNTMVAQEPHHVAFPQTTSKRLDSGLHVVVCDRGEAQMVEVSLDLKAKYYYDPEHQQGLSLFVSKMLLEGTQRYDCQQLADAFESRGMSITILPGFITVTMLSVDLEYGCSLLNEILTNSIFAPEAVEKVRGQLLAELDDFWNDPSQFAGQLVREQIYHGHPYEKNLLGTQESIQRIQRDDLIAFYKQYITPQDTHLAVVGHIEGQDPFSIIEKTLGKWVGPEVVDMQFPVLVAPQSKTINFPLNRDQVTLSYAGLSVARINEDYEKLLLFDQLFTGGSSGSMSCRLFLLREETGFFYSIGGSLIAGATDQPGMIIVSTMVSLDSLKEAEKVIEHSFKNATTGVAQQEFVDAKNSVLHSLIDNFDSNTHVARTLLFLARYGLPNDYFDVRMSTIQAMTLDEVLGVVRRIVRPESLIKLRIGRV